MTSCANEFCARPEHEPIACDCECHTLGSRALLNRLFAAKASTSRTSRWNRLVARFDLATRIRLARRSA